MDKEKRKTILRESFTLAAANGVGLALGMGALNVLINGMSVDRAIIMGVSVFALQVLMATPAYYYFDYRRRLPKLSQ